MRRYLLVALLVTLSMTTFGLAQQGDWSQLMAAGKRARESQNLRAAAKFYRAAVEAADTGRDQVKLADAFAALGGVLLKQGRVLQAKHSLKKAVALYDQYVSPDSMQASEVDRTLASIYVQARQYSQAGQALAAAVHALGEQVGPTDDNLLRLKVQLADLYVRDAEYDNAVALCGTLIPSLSRIYGERDSRTVSAIRSYVTALHRLRRDREARRWTRKLAASAARKPGFAGADVGEVEGAVGGQIGVYRVGVTGHRPAVPDVLRVVRGGKVIAEGIVEHVGSKSCVMSLRGTATVLVGDRVVFARPGSRRAPVPDSRPGTRIITSESSRYGGAAWQHLLASGRVHLVTDGRASRRVDAIGQKVAAASHCPVRWHFFVVEDPHPNAFTVGEGYVAVTSGLLGLHLNDAELAGVLAHEVAHGVLQHTMEAVNQERRVKRALADYHQAEQLYNRYTQEFERETQGLDPNGLEYHQDLDDYQSEIVTVKRRMSRFKREARHCLGYQKHQHEIDREHEVEADAAGMRYAVTAGYPPGGLMSALLKVQADGVERFGKAYDGEGLSHPPTARRIQILKKVYSDWQSQGYHR